MTDGSKEIVRLTDPLQESIGNMMVIMFPKSTSKNYVLAVNIAQGAAFFKESLINGILINYAVFSKSREQAGRVQGLLDYISDWKGVQRVGWVRRQP
jgi:hypothetical protein